MDEADLRTTLCELGRSLYDRGHNAPGDGNLSVRLDARTLLCTPTASHKGRLTPDRIVLVDLATGQPLDGQRCSTEIRMHLAIYEERADVHAIVHAHSPHAVAMSVAGVSFAEPVVPEALFALGRVPTVPYASPATSDVADAVRPYARRAEAFVLERHGPVALGRTLEEAHARIEVLEHTARITVLARSLGRAEPIAADEAESLLRRALAAGAISRPG